MAKQNDANDSVILVHISDLHFGQDAHRDEEEALCEAIVRDVVKVRKCLGPPHAIVCTGDLAFSGKPEQYARVKDFFERLCKRVEISKEQVFIVPGNHDIDRSIASNWRSAHLGIRVDPKGAISSLLNLRDGKEAEAIAVFQKLSAFAAFLKEFNGVSISHKNPYWEKSFESPLGPIAVLGLNSALLCFDDDDSPANLALGASQLNLTHQRSFTRALRLALVHHDPSCLLDGKELQNNLSAHPHLLLCGHIHLPGVNAVHPLGHGSRIELVGGAAQLPRAERADNKHSYAWYRITKDGLDGFQRIKELKEPDFTYAPPTAHAEGKRYHQHLGEYSHLSVEKLPKYFQEWLSGTVSSSRTSIPPTSGRPFSSPPEQTPMDDSSCRAPIVPEPPTQSPARFAVPATATPIPPAVAPKAPDPPYDDSGQHTGEIEQESLAPKPIHDRKTLLSGTPPPVVIAEMTARLEARRALSSNPKPPEAPGVLDEKPTQDEAAQPPLPSPVPIPSGTGADLRRKILSPRTVLGGISALGVVGLMLMFFIRATPTTTSGWLTGTFPKLTPVMPLKPVVPPSSSISFDYIGTEDALAKVALNLEKFCGSKRPSGVKQEDTGQIRVQFGRDGKAKDVKVVGGLHMTVVTLKECIEKEFMGVQIPAFTVITPRALGQPKHNLKENADGITITRGFSFKTSK